MYYSHENKILYTTAIEEYSKLFTECLAMTDYIKLYNLYQRIFASSLSDEYQRGIDKTFYDRLLSTMDKNLDRELRSVEFMQALSKYLIALSHLIKHSKFYGYDRLLEETMNFNLNRYFLNNFAILSKATGPAG